MTTLSAVITIGIDPTIELGPITIGWHGLTIANGILIGGVAVATTPAAAAWTPSASVRSGRS